LKAGSHKLESPFTADILMAALNDTVVPAGTFETLQLDGTITLAGYTILQGFFLARGVGPVRDVSSDMEGNQSLLELMSTNVGSQDLAVTEVSPPKVVTFTKTSSSKTAKVKVTVQNRSPHPETIHDAAILRNTVRLTVDSLGTCPSPQPVMKTDHLNFPLILKPKQLLKLTFDVTFTCVNDPKRSTAKTSDHYDYRYQALVSHGALDGKEDTHPFDDVCPRNVVPPYEIDPNPDGTIQDKGCGPQKPDGTFGGDILTDVIVK
jgi:hypothetical protein